MYPFRYFPKSPVRYPAAESLVAIVSPSHRAKASTQLSLPVHPVVSGIMPLRNAVRAGQHSGETVNAWSKRTPSAAIPVTVGIAHSVSTRWSSVITTTTFRAVDVVGPGGELTTMGAERVLFVSLVSGSAPGPSAFAMMYRLPGDVPAGIVRTADP